MRFLLSILLSVICFSQAAEKLKVTVYYETLGLECVRFFRKPLEPTYNELVEYIDLDLVPFGKGSAKKDGDKWKFECRHGEEECEVSAYDSCAVDIAPAPKAFAFAKCTMTQVAPTVKDMVKIAEKHGGKWKFECEHGPKECEANAYHSCAVGIASKREALQFATCAFIQFTPTSTSAMKWCGKRSGITYASLDACRQKRGDELLAVNAEKSKNVGYQTVPAIAFNGKYDPKESDIATKNLKKIICSKLKNVPPQCKVYGEH